MAYKTYKDLHPALRRIQNKKYYADGGKVEISQDDVIDNIEVETIASSFSHGQEANIQKKNSHLEDQETMKILNADPLWRDTGVSLLKGAIEGAEFLAELGTNAFKAVTPKNVGKLIAGQKVDWADYDFTPDSVELSQERSRALAESILSKHMPAAEAKVRIERIFNNRELLGSFIDPFVVAGVGIKALKAVKSFLKTSKIGASVSELPLATQKAYTTKLADRVKHLDDTDPEYVKELERLAEELWNTEIEGQIIDGRTFTKEIVDQETLGPSTAAQVIWKTDSAVVQLRKITSLQDFSDWLHEFGHILEPDGNILFSFDSSRRGIFIEETAAMRFAINKSKELGFPEDALRRITNSQIEILDSYLEAYIDPVGLYRFDPDSVSMSSQQSEESLQAAKNFMNEFGGGTGDDMVNAAKGIREKNIEDYYESGEEISELDEIFESDYSYENPEFDDIIDNIEEETLGTGSTRAAIGKPKSWFVKTTDGTVEEFIGTAKEFQEKFNVGVSASKKAKGNLEDGAQWSKDPENFTEFKSGATIENPLIPKIDPSDYTLDEAFEKARLLPRSEKKLPFVDRLKLENLVDTSIAKVLGNKDFFKTIPDKEVKTTFDKELYRWNASADKGYPHPYFEDALNKKVWAAKQRNDGVIPEGYLTKLDARNYVNASIEEQRKYLISIGKLKNLTSDSAISKLGDQSTTYGQNTPGLKNLAHRVSDEAWIEIAGGLATEFGHYPPEIFNKIVGWARKRSTKVFNVSYDSPSGFKIHTDGALQRIENAPFPEAQTGSRWLKMQELTGDLPKDHWIHNVKFSKNKESTGNKHSSHFFETPQTKSQYLELVRETQIIDSVDNLPSKLDLTTQQDSAKIASALENLFNFNQGSIRIRSDWFEKRGRARYGNKGVTHDKLSLASLQNDPMSNAVLIQLRDKTDLSQKEFDSVIENIVEIGYQSKSGSRRVFGTGVGGFNSNFWRPPYIGPLAGPNRIRPTSTVPEDSPLRRVLQLSPKELERRRAAILRRIEEETKPN